MADRGQRGNDDGWTRKWRGGEPGRGFGRPGTPVPSEGYQGGGFGNYAKGEPWRTPGPHTGRGPKGYRRSDDRIREDVCERLTHHGHLDASAIRISVEDGEVTLEGTVESRRDKRLAEDAVEGLSGVKDVHNRLRIGPPAPRGEERGRDSAKEISRES